MAPQTIFVTNTNDFHHSDRFDGVDFDFPPRQKIAISVDAARHMFGFGNPDKTETLVRLGWAMEYDPKMKAFRENPEGVKQLARFVFTQAVMVEAPAEETAALTAPSSMPPADDLEIA